MWRHPRAPAAFTRVCLVLRFYVVCLSCASRACSARGSCFPVPSSPLLFLRCVCVVLWVTVFTHPPRGVCCSGRATRWCAVTRVRPRVRPYVLVVCIWSVHCVVCVYPHLLCVHGNRFGLSRHSGNSNRAPHDMSSRGPRLAVRNSRTSCCPPHLPCSSAFTGVVTVFPVLVRERSRAFTLLCSLANVCYCGERGNVPCCSGTFRRSSVVTVGVTSFCNHILLYTLPSTASPLTSHLTPRNSGTGRRRATPTHHTISILVGSAVANRIRYRRTHTALPPSTITPCARASPPPSSPRARTPTPPDNAQLALFETSDGQDVTAKTRNRRRYRHADETERVEGARTAPGENQARATHE